MDYFVTGATGLVGQRLVAELLARSGDTRVHALVRPQSLTRLTKLQSTWPGGDRVEPVIGDVSRPGLGVNDALPPIGHFFHVAASYDLALGEREAFVNNVLGTLHAVQLANQLGVRGFHYTSSIGVAGRFVGRFTEQMGDEGQLIDNAYFASKLQAEMVLRSTVEVPFAIYRLGAVVGDSETGRMTKADGAYYFFPLVKALAKLPPWFRVPGPEGGFANVVPVDYAAKVLCHIAHLPESRFNGEVFHVVDAAPVRIGEAIRAGLTTQGGPKLQPLVPLRIARRVSRASKVVPFRGAVRSRVLAAIDLPEQMVDWRDFDALFDTARLEVALDESGLTCPPFESYVSELFEYWREHLDPRSLTARLDRVLAGRRVLLTGASRGVGRSAARLLGQADCTLFVVARDVTALDELRGELADGAATVVPLRCDLADRSAVRALVEEVTGGWGGVDVLINNAGKSIRRAVEHSRGRLMDYDRTMEVNYFAPVALTLGFLPGMRARRVGHVINISSIGLQASMSRFGAYNASKAALDAFVASTASEVWSEDVRFTTVYLPLVRTAMSAPTTAFRRLPSISSDEAAQLIARAVLGRAVRVSTPLGTFAMLGETVIPRFMRQLMRLEYAVLPESEASLKSAASAPDINLERPIPSPGQSPIHDLQSLSGMAPTVGRDTAAARS